MATSAAAPGASCDVMELQGCRLDSFQAAKSIECIFSRIRHRGDGRAGGAKAPPVFVAKICKLIKLKAKEVNILKILTSDLYQRCMRHIVRGIHHVNLT